MKYLIGLDIDGTILDDDKHLSKETIAYLKKLSDDGHIVCLITGRPYRTTKPIYDELGLNTPMGNYSGSLLHHPNDENFKGYRYTMDEKYLLDVFSRFKSGILNAFFEIDDKVYLYKEDAGLREWLSENTESLEVGDFVGRVDHPLCGAVFFIEPNISEQLKEYIEENHSTNIGYRLWYSHKEDEYHVVELYTLLASKQTALEEIRKHYDIPYVNTIAVGDGGNDVEMLRYAYNSAAMINGMDYVKESAKTITKYSNNENGVIDYLKSIIEED